jgi:hypothetical protein
MRSRLIVAGLWVGPVLLVSGCGGGKATTTPPAHVAQAAINYHRATTIVYFRPTTKTGLLRRGFSISKTVTSGSCNASGYVTGAYRCAGQENGIYDPCWPLGKLAGTHRVFCPLEPWSKSGVELILATPIEPYTSPPSPMPEPPWAVKLITGPLCTKMVGAVSTFNGIPVRYSCRGQVLLGLPDRRRPLWTAQVMLPTIITRPSYRIKLRYGAITPIVEAWYGIGYPD